MQSSINSIFLWKKISIIINIFLIKEGIYRKQETESVPMLCSKPCSLCGTCSFRVWRDQYALREVANAGAKQKWLYGEMGKESQKAGMRGSGKTFQYRGRLNVSPLINQCVQKWWWHKQCAVCRKTWSKWLGGGGSQREANWLSGGLLLPSRLRGLIWAQGEFEVKLNSPASVLMWLGVDESSQGTEDTLFM